MRAQSTEIDSTFGALQELNYLADSNNFFTWIVEQFEPHLGHRILEVGAGLGTVAQIIAKRRPHSSVTAIEPAANVYGELLTNTTSTPNIMPMQVTSSELLASGVERFDSVVYVNVLEHILDDSRRVALRTPIAAPGRHLGDLCASNAQALRHPRLTSPDTIAATSVPACAR